MQVETQDVLEVGESIIAAEAHVVAKERQHQRVGESLRDDGKIHAGDARPEGKPSEHEGEHPRRERHHQERHGKMVESMPEPRQRLIVQKHHEVGQNGIAVDAPRANLAHQIHAHGISTQAKKAACPRLRIPQYPQMRSRRKGQHAVAQILAEEGDGEVDR